MTPQSLAEILDSEKYIYLGKERDNNRVSKLFFLKVMIISISLFKIQRMEM